MGEAKARKTKAHLEAERKVVELEKKIVDAEKTKEYYNKLYTDDHTVLEGLHDVLDDLGIRKYRDENKYSVIPIAVRLFAWAMGAQEKLREKN